MDTELGNITDDNLKIVPEVGPSSSRETPDLADCYKLGVNACVAKPADFLEFRKALKQLGIGGVAVNEPPPFRSRTETTVPARKADCPGKETVNHEIPAPHPAVGG